MRLAVTSKQMKEMDAYMIHSLHIPGIVLMENAARGVVDFIVQRFQGGRAIVFCGCGNNGGDGFAAARGLIARGFDVRVILVGEEGNLKGDALINYEFFVALTGRLAVVQTAYELEMALEEAGTADVVVDALFGTGLARDIEGVYALAVNQMNKMKAFRVSVDIPSGISADTGAILGTAVRAHATVTFQYPKLGHFLYPGREYTGELAVIRIGVDEGCPVLDALDVTVYEPNDPDVHLLKRHPNTNKGDYGKLLAIAGSTGMAGAAILCCRAANRSGAGLVTLASVDYVVNMVQACVPETVCKVLPGEMESMTKNAIYVIDRIVKEKTALAIGPGIQENSDTQEIVNHIVLEHDIVKVLDADALNVLSRNPDVLLNKTGEVILTPHPKEFARIINCSVQAILNDPIGIARDFIEKYDVTLVLKGAVTIVASRENGIALVACGSPGMAKGGSGDVLTGIISSLAAQGMGAYASALLGVYINGMAGMIAADAKGEYSMTPQDTVECIGEAMKKVLKDASEPSEIDESALMDEYNSDFDAEEAETEEEEPIPEPMPQPVFTQTEKQVFVDETPYATEEEFDIPVVKEEERKPFYTRRRIVPKQ